MSISEALLAEYEVLSQGRGFVDVSDRTKIELRGEDRASFLHNFCTNDIKGLSVGQWCEAFICNVKGHVIGHVLVYCDENSLWLDTVPGQSETLLAHLDRYLIREKVELIDQTANYREYLVVGKRPELPGAIVRPSPIAGPTSWLVTCPSKELSTDRSEPGGGLTECGRESLEILRLEAGFPWFGADITADNLPQEVNRNAQAINFKKGCYLGQETVARIDALGHVNKTLCGVAFSGDGATTGTELLADGKVVGAVTSIVWSPKLHQPLALAYIRRGNNSSGTTLESSAGQAKVVALPIENT